jgi:hypothetical protein
MPFGSVFLAAASFYFDLCTTYFVADGLGMIVTGFADHDLFDNSFLLADDRLLPSFPDLRHCFCFSIPVADGAVHRTPLHYNLLIMQLNRLLHRFFDDTPVDTHPSAFDFAFADSQLLFLDRNRSRVSLAEIIRSSTCISSHVRRLEVDVSI